MKFYLRYCCAMCFALISFLLATPQRAQAQTRKAYVVQSADKTTLTFYYDDQRATHTGTTCGIEVKKGEGSHTFPGWAGTYDVENSTTTRVVFDASFRDFRPTTTARWFYNCDELKQIEGLEYLNTQNVTDMNGMFYGCRYLPSLDLSHFNTQNVTYMSDMFYGCSGLTSLDVSNFNTQKVVFMSEMFSGCRALTTIRCNKAWLYDNTNTAWPAGRVSYRMFDNCTKLKGAVAYDENKTDATMANPETGYFTAKPTAVESVRFGADGAQHIYTLQGKRVRRAWKHLPAGVYVVNGKKTVKL